MLVLGVVLGSKLQRHLSKYSCQRMGRLALQTLKGTHYLLYNPGSTWWCVIILIGIVRSDVKIIIKLVLDRRVVTINVYPIQSV